MSLSSFIDMAKKAAEDSMGKAATNTTANLERLKTTFEDYQNSFNPTGLSSFSVLASDDTLSAMSSTLGQSSTAQSVETLITAITKIQTAEEDARETLTNLRDMFGMTGSEIISIAANAATDEILAKFTNNIIQAEDVLSVSFDIADGIPSVTNYITGKFPILEGGIPEGEDAIEYLNTVAGSFMNTVSSNISAITQDAQEGFNAMMGVYNELAEGAYEGLTEAAKSALETVETITEIPTIASIQASKALESTFASISKIQNSQFAIDCMDKANEMIPEIESAMEAFDNFGWEGSGLGADDMGGYLNDIANSESLGNIVSNVLDGCPGIEQCGKKLTSAIKSANQAVEKTQEKVKEATEAVEDILDSFW